MMGRYWALRLASFVFRGVGIFVFAFGFFQLAYPVEDWKTGSVDLQFFPHPSLVYQSIDNSEIIMATIPLSRLLHGIFYSLALYAIGQAFIAIYEMKRESEIVNRAIMSRANKRSSVPPADESVKLEWGSLKPEAPMGYSRRHRHAAPEVPPDDPRRPQAYTKPSISYAPRPSPRPITARMPPTPPERGTARVRITYNQDPKPRERRRLQSAEEPTTGDTYTYGRPGKRENQD